jgi:GNAT superfamily N-acetyltransferase
MTSRRPVVRLRELRRDDAATLDAIMTGLSPHSRHLRFHSPLRRLTAGMRGTLLDVDGHDHVGLVATTGRDGPIGVARFIRDPVHRTEAEIAFAVVDAWHGRGVGRLLVENLVERAVAAGIGRIRARVLVENSAALALLRGVLPTALLHRDGDVVELTALVGSARSWEITMDDILVDLVG